MVSQVLSDMLGLSVLCTDHLRGWLGRMLIWFLEKETSAYHHLHHLVLAIMHNNIYELKITF
jgi:hypothetical protein